MKECGSQKTEMELRALLGCFLFSGDDVEKKIRVLSGGEKARVALAKTIVSKANFLILDEPTNHLDMHSVELLAEALNKYQGSYILVSHDRYFISKTANKIWEIVDHKIKEFKGTYPEWVEWNERMASRKPEENLKSEVRNTRLEVKAEQKAINSNHNQQQQNANHKLQTANPNAQTANSPINRELQKELQKQQRRLVNLEEDINKAVQEKLKLEQALALPENYSDRKKFITTENDFNKAASQLEQLNKQYEQLFEKVMELEMQFAG
jgi:ATP-binding cassette subfamily F protein 3